MPFTAKISIYMQENIEISIIDKRETNYEKSNEFL